MRIAFVTMQLGHSYVHGTERYVATLGGALRQRGHKVKFLAGDPKARKRAGSLGASVDPEREVFAYPTRGWTAVQGVSLRRVEGWLRRERPDLVHLVSPGHVGMGVALACRRMGVPVVTTAMDFWWICPRGTLLRDGSRICDGTPDWRQCLACVLRDHPRRSRSALSRLAPVGAPLAFGLLAAGSVMWGGSLAEAARWTRRRRILSQVLRDIDEIIFPSPATRDAIGPHLCHDRWQEIPYGLPPEWFDAPRPAEERKSSPPQDLVFGFAGSLQPHKGAHLVLGAVRRLGWKRTRLRVAGTLDDESYWSRLQRLARGLSVEFTGPLSESQMRAFLRTLDVFVLPSCWPENLPFVLLEAQAAGLPVIASDVPGISHRIPASRMLFATGSEEDLARAMSEFQAPSGGAPPPRVSTLEEMTAATEAVYRRALSRRGRSSGRDD